MLISVWSSNVCSSDLARLQHDHRRVVRLGGGDARHPSRCRGAAEGTGSGGGLTDRIIMITWLRKREAPLLMPRKVPHGSGSGRRVAVGAGRAVPELGRASCREGVCQYV